MEDRRLNLDRGAEPQGAECGEAKGGPQTIPENRECLRTVRGGYSCWINGLLGRRLRRER